MTDITVTKIIDDGRVYAQYTFADGSAVTEKADPHIVHDAPTSVTEGTAVVVTLTFVDFDDVQRTDSGGVLLLEIDDVEVALPVNDGSATLHIELFESATVRQRPPYFCDARMEPFHIEVAT